MRNQSQWNESVVDKDEIDVRPFRRLAKVRELIEHLIKTGFEGTITLHMIHGYIKKVELTQEVELK